MSKIAMGGTKGHSSLSLKSTNHHKGIVIGTAVFLLCTCVGIIAGTYIKQHIEGTNAASSNITVTNNNQVVTHDQGTPTITRTSTVMIKDANARYGYTLSARISNNSIPGATVRIGSSSSATCTVSSPCTITTAATPITILETTGSLSAPNSATAASGHTTDWAITITLPTNTPLGNYTIDIAYSEEPVIPIPAMQDFTAAECQALLPGETIQRRDNRDDKIYRVRKMADSRCWMIDNLALDLAIPNAPAYSPSAVLISDPQTSINAPAQYILNNNIAGQGQIPNNGNPIPSYMYNWCAAMGDTSTNCATTLAYTQDQPATPQVGICPGPADASGFRLPMTGVDPSPSIVGDGTNQATAANTTTSEFAKLDIWLGGAGTYTFMYGNSFPNFAATTTSALSWSANLSGAYMSQWSGQGAGGIWWSSTAYSGTHGYALYIYTPNHIDPSYDYLIHKGGDFAVRCIL